MGVLLSHMETRHVLALLAMATLPLLPALFKQPAQPAFAAQDGDEVFKTVPLEGGYSAVNYKRGGTSEEVAVYKNGELVATHKAKNLDGSVRDHCTLTMFSESHIFFVNPFHSVVQVYSPTQLLYHGLRSGADPVDVDKMEFEGFLFKDNAGWYPIHQAERKIRERGVYGY